MRRIRRIVSILFAACLTTGAWAAAPKPLPSLHVEGKWLVDTYGNHVVLHGVMDTPSAWFNNGRWGWSYDDAGRQRCLTYFEKLFTGLEKANCDVFRLHLEPAWTNDNSYTYAVASAQPSNASGEADIKHFNPTRLTTYLKSLYFPLMQKAMNHGMYVVVRPPGVCPDPIQVGGYYQKYLLQVWDLFTQNDSIRKYSGQISIELANEPVGVKNYQGNDDKKALHDFFQPIVDRIRANGFTGIIWVPGSGWQANYADYKTYPITGYNIGYAVHDYDGWYGCEDKKNSASTVAQATKNKITQFHNQVPVVDTNPIIITEIDWSPKKKDVPGHENEHGEQVEGNLGTWATGRTSVWGTITKGVHDYYGNISMTLSGTACLIDIDTLLNKNGKVVPAFGGEPEACGKACMDWYAEYAKVDNPKPDNVSAPVSDNGKNTFKNPIVRADFPDPDVIRVGDTYYMVSTTMTHFPGATILKSQDLVNWEYCAHPLQQLTTTDGAYKLLNNKNAYASGMWACSMKYHNGKFHILINEKRPVDGWELQGWLLTATNPEGKWTMKKLGRSYYDPGMLFDNGKVYVACGIGDIFVCELDENFNFKREKKILEGKSGLEGCHFYKKGDYYYIYATYGGWPSGQAVFRSKDPFGPYEEKMVVEKSYNNVPNTIHQGALVEAVNGKWWTVMQEDLGALGRMPNLQPVNWVSDWPVVGKNGTPYKSFTENITKPKAVGDISMKHLPTSDVFRTFPLGKQWEWNHQPVDTAWTLTARPSWLRLKTSTVSKTLHQARNTLTQRIFAIPDKYTTGTIRMDASKLTDGDRAGICIFQDPYAAIAVEKKDDKIQLVWWKDKVATGNSDNFKADEKTQDIELPDSIIYLRAAIKYGENKAKFYYSIDNKEWKSLGGDTEMGFNLTVFVGARFGLFCYATKKKGGYADFDWFTTEASFDEAETYPETFTAPSDNMFKVTKIAPAANYLEALIDDKREPNIVATYADKHTEIVSNIVEYTPAEAGIVEFNNGKMFGVGQGSTTVDVTYTDLLGNESKTSFKARSGYFPLDLQYISSTLVGNGTYNHGTSASVFKFITENSQIGWKYDSKMDFSDYKYLVINLNAKQTANAKVNLYTSTSLTGACCTVPLSTTDKQTVIDLSTLKYTSSTSKGKALDLTKIYLVTFSSGTANKAITVLDMFLSNDAQYETVGIVDVDWHQQLQQRQTVDVYTLSGRVVRRAVSRSEALKGLPAGLYLMDGKRIMVK